MKRAVATSVLLVLVAIGVLYWTQTRNGPFFVSGMLESDEIRVGSRVGGRVEAVVAAEGQALRPGDVILVLEPYDLRERLAQAQRQLGARRATQARVDAGFRAEEVAQARARRDLRKATLDKLVAGKRPLEIEILKDQLDVARADQRLAEVDYERVKRLYEEARAAQQEMDYVETRLAAARARFAAAEDELKLAEEGTRAEEIAEARALLAEAEAQLAMLVEGSRVEDKAEAAAHTAAAEAEVAAIERQLAELTIRAPAASVVDALDLQPGDLVAPNAPVAALVDPQSLYVRAYLPENRRAAVGDAVRIAIDAFPGRRFAGRITFIARQAEFTPSNTQTTEERSKLVFRIKVRLDEGHDVLRAGMAADVYFGAAP
ncbi:MAG: HlyD family secretion protein [Phycisphaerae bacterium]